MMIHRFTRGELYDLVWSKPLSKLATELGISDVAIAKACRRADIPSPGVGYWAKVHHGKKVLRTPLPPPTPKTPAIVKISPGPSNLIRALTPEVQERIAMESTEEWRIEVPEALRNLHSILRELLEDDRNHRAGSPQPRGYQRPSRHHTGIERRRLINLNALFSALEKRGHQIVANPQNPLDIDLVVDGERIEFSLSERQKQFKRDLTPEEMGKPWKAAFGVKSKTVLEPTGVLIFKIHTSIGTGVRTQWRDGARGPLEKRLNEIVAGLFAAAATIRHQRLEREEEQRRLLTERMERERMEEVRREEVRRTQALLQRVSRWLQAADVHAYVDAVQRAVRMGRIKIDPERLETWASWALTFAGQIDPIVAGDALAESGPARIGSG